MRLPVASCVLFVLASGSIAASGQDRVAGELRDREVHSRISGALRAAPHAITEARSDYWLIIPISGNSQGNFGTFYRSDVMISNHRDVSQTVKISYCPAALACSAGPQRTVTVPANGILFLDDIVGKTLGASGIGTLDFRARDAADSLDTDAKIDVFSRIYTPMANTAGTQFAGGASSLSFPGIMIDEVSGTKPAFILGLKQDATFRSNVGIFNHDIFDPHTFTVTIVPASGAPTTFTVNVPAWSVVQTGFPAGNFGSFMAIVTPPADMSGEWWSTYAASNDNITGDGWVSIGSQNQ